LGLAEGSSNVRERRRLQQRGKCTILGPAVSLDSRQADSSQLVRLDAGGASRDVLFGLDLAALTGRLTAAGEPGWRGRQLAEALYRQRIANVEEITTLPKTLRRRLAEEGWRVGRPKIAQAFTSVDGTERYIVECGGGTTVETVWMPEGDGGESGDGSDAEGPEEGTRRQRATICVSSQAGCAVNCQFCLTGKLACNATCRQARWRDRCWPCLTGTAWRWAGTG